jgi:hypothetical protein
MSAPELMGVAVGQIWRDNDPRGNRFVRVVGLSSAFANIQRVHESGAPLFTKRGDKLIAQPVTTTRLERFGKNGRIGFTLVRVVA